MPAAPCGTVPAGAPPCVGRGLVRPDGWVVAPGVPGWPGIVAAGCPGAVGVDLPGAAGVPGIVVGVPGFCTPAAPCGMAPLTGAPPGVVRGPTRPDGWVVAPGVPGWPGVVAVGCPGVVGADLPGAVGVPGVVVGAPGFCMPAAPCGMAPLTGAPPGVVRGPTRPDGWVAAPGVPG